MKFQKMPRPLNGAILFLTFGFVGLIPWAPGTFGTLAAMPFLYLLGRWQIPWVLIVPFLIILTAGACFLSHHIQNTHHVKDPGWIVIDEVIGICVTWLFWPTGNLKHLVGLFLLFRFFDIIKIWPASYFDKEVNHGSGVILDDIVSGIYAGLSFLLIQKILPFA